MKPRDLVAVVRPQPCCGDASGVGVIFRIDSIQPGDTVCTECHRETLSDSAFPKSGHGYLLSVLRKINPPSVPTSTESTRELTV
jgi:hypothetical protein